MAQDGAQWRAPVNSVHAFGHHKYRASWQYGKLYQLLNDSAHGVQFIIIIIIIHVMEMDHLLTRFGLTNPEVSSKSTMIPSARQGEVLYG